MKDRVNREKLVNMIVTGILANEIIEEYGDKLRECIIQNMSSGRIIQELRLENCYCNDSITRGFNYSPQTLRRAVLIAQEGLEGDGSRLPRIIGIKESIPYYLINSKKKNVEVHPKVRRRVALEGVIARGRKPWLRYEDLPYGDPRPGELSSMIQMLKNPRFYHNKGRHKDMPNWKKISRALGRQYPESGERPLNSIRKTYYKKSKN